MEGKIRSPCVDTDHEICPVHGDLSTKFQLLMEKIDINSSRGEEVAERTSHLSEQFTEVLMRLERGTFNFATLDGRLKKIEVLVYGAVGMILTSVFGTLIYHIIRKGGE